MLNRLKDDFSGEVKIKEVVILAIIIGMFAYGHDIVRITYEAADKIEALMKPNDPPANIEDEE